MSHETYRVRRATVDDLPALLALWHAMRFPVTDLELEKRLTEFQVAVDDAGNLLGAIAFTMAGNQGWIQHEAFHDFSQAEQLRALFWARIQNLAANHGLFRLWTREDAPFWRQLEFVPASTDALQKLPAAWKGGSPRWLTLQLRAEVAMETLAGTMDVEALLKQEREQTQKTLARAETMKRVALLVAVLLAVFVGVLFLYALKRDPEAMQQFFHR